MTTSVAVLAPAEQTEGTRSQVLRWLKNIGESVEENEPLIEIETDKVTVEVASPGAGVLREILKGEQEEIAPGEVLGRIEAVGAEGAASPGGGAAGSGEVSPDGAGAMSDVGLARSSARESGASGASAGRGDIAGASDALAAGGGGAGSRDAAVVGDGLAGTNGGASRAESASAAAGSANAEQAPAGPAAGRLSPAVRRLLAENSLDPATIRGTGQGGRITVEDVLAKLASGGGAVAVGQAAAAGPAAISPAAGAAPASTRRTPASSPSPNASGAGATRSVPHTPVRKRIAEHMVQSLLHTAPHVTTVFEADMTAVLAHRQKHRDEFAKRGVPLTLTAYFLQGTVDAIRAVPEVNSKWTDSALELFDSIHIGVGTAVEDVGLVVPVLRDVGSRDLFSTAEGLNDLVTRAREGKLTPADVRGGTFTISNHGVSGSLVATPIIINQPQSAILGIGKLEKRLVVLEHGGEDRVAIRPRCYVTLTIDHRVMDGHRANLFLQTFVERLTSWS